MDNTTLAVAPAIPQLPNYSEDMKNADIIEESDFSFDGYQVVRSKFFAHISEPSISFSN